MTKRHYQQMIYDHLNDITTYKKLDTDIDKNVLKLLIKTNLERILSSSKFTSQKESFKAVICGKNFFRCDYLKEGLTLSWRMFLLYRNQSIDLLCKPMDWFLCDRDIRHEKVNRVLKLKSSVYNIYIKCL